MDGPYRIPHEGNLRVSGSDSFRSFRILRNCVASEYEQLVNQLVPVHARERCHAPQLDGPKPSMAAHNFMSPHLNDVRG